MRKNWLWVAVAMVSLPAAAFAKDHEGDRFEVTLNGGFMTYAGDVAAITTPGGAYGVSGVGDIYRRNGVNLAGEVGYVGGVYNTERLFSSNRSTIVENGGQALVRVGPELGPVEPYALGGVSVQRLSVSDEAATNGLIRDGTHTRIPVGLGFQVKPMGEASSLLVGARGTYSFATNDPSFRPLIPNTNGAATWAGQAQVGGTF